MYDVEKLLYKNGELAHHGIDGQKWGKRNGPPYPLDSSVSTGKKLLKRIADKIKSRKEKKSGKKESNKNDDGYVKDKNGFLTKNIDLKDSRGKSTKLHIIIDEDVDDIKNVKDTVNKVVKDFKSYDKIAREAILDNMRGRLGINSTKSDAFMRGLQNPTMEIYDNEAVIGYDSPYTGHYHSVHVDLKTKKVRYASMDG